MTIEMSKKMGEVTAMEMLTFLGAEGLGTGVGFVGGAFLGRQVQNSLFKKKDADLVTTQDKLLAWTGNNLPKIAGWFVIRNYVTGWKGLGLGKRASARPDYVTEILTDTSKALAGSVAFDSIMRLSNGGKNPATATINGREILGEAQGEPQNAQILRSDMQRLIQENSELRTKLNESLRRLSSNVNQNPPQIAAPRIVQQAPQIVQQPQIAPQPVVQYQSQPAPVVHVQPAQPLPVTSAAPIVRVQPVAPVSAPPVQAQHVSTPVITAPVVSGNASGNISGMDNVQERQKKYQFMPDNIPAVNPVQDRQKKHGFMDQQPVPPMTPSDVMERQRRHGFMSTGAESIAAVCGML